MRSLMQAAKFLFHDQSRARPDEGEKACAHQSSATPHWPCAAVHEIFARNMAACVLLCLVSGRSKGPMRAFMHVSIRAVCLDRWKYVRPWLSWKGCLGHAHKCAPCRADGDIMVVRELRKLSNEARRATKTAARTADESLKWLEWSQLLTARPLSFRCLPSRALRAASRFIAVSMPETCQLFCTGKLHYG